MKNIAGVFNEVSGVQCSVSAIRKIGISQDRINVVAPGTSEPQLEARVRVSNTEQPGMGGAMGGAIGAAMGVAGGLEIGVAVATFLIPGVGPILAAGLGALVFGAGGAYAGSVAGSKVEESIEGFPHDELFVYEDAVQHGRSVVFVVADSENEADQVDAALRTCGAESIDAARDQWWVGLRDDERAHYESTTNKPFDSQEEHYRKGFEAALDRRAGDKTYSQDLDRLRECFGESCEHEAFQHGYQRARTRKTQAE